MPVPRTSSIRRALTLSRGRNVTRTVSEVPSDAPWGGPSNSLARDSDTSAYTRGASSDYESAGFDDESDFEPDDHGPHRGRLCAACAPRAILACVQNLPVFEPPLAAEEWTWSFYQCWYIFIILMTFATLAFVPLDIAFSPSAGARPMATQFRLAVPARPSSVAYEIARCVSSHAVHNRRMSLTHGPLRSTQSMRDPTISRLPRYAGLCSIDSGFDFVQIVLTVAFGIDIFINFNVAVWDPRRRRVHHGRKAIARAYVLGGPVPWFWIDLLAVLPFDAMVGSIVGCAERNQAWDVLRLTMCFRLLRLVRPGLAHPAAAAWPSSVCFDAAPDGVLAAAARRLCLRALCLAVCWLHWRMRLLCAGSARWL
jgi:Ion transport protein